MNSTIPSQIVRLATEIGLPPGKVSFDTQFAGWIADITIGTDILHLWEDRGEFWASFERQGKTTFIAQPESWVAPTSLQSKLRHSLLLFRDSINCEAISATIEPSHSPEPPPSAVH